MRVNTTFLEMYWDLGADIVMKQTQAKWGEGFILQLSKDLSAEFPDIKGFSYSNIKHIKHWYLFYRGEFTKGQQPVSLFRQQSVAQLAPPAPAQILQIPWGHNYVVIELKAGEFRPEYVGKLNFYLSAVDDLMRHPDDKPSIGLILCKSKERVIAEYALRDISKPIGIANWRTKLVASLPTELKGKLPSIKEIEAELGRETNKSKKS